MKEKIVQKAADLFLTYGVRSVTMDEIAAEMGISKKTIYANYSNKTALIEACAWHVSENIEASIEEVRKNKTNPVQQLYDIKDLVSQHLKDETSSPQFQLKKYFPKVYKKVIDKQLKIMEGFVLENLQQGISEGLYRQDLPQTFISRIYFIGLMGIRDKEMYPDTEFNDKELSEAFLEYHFRAVVTPKGYEILETIIKDNKE